MRASEVREWQYMYRGEWDTKEHSDQSGESSW